MRPARKTLAAPSPPPNTRIRTYVNRRDGNPFALLIADSPGEQGTNVYLCDRYAEGSHQDTGQP